MQVSFECEGADRTVYIYAGTQLISEFEDAASNTYSAGTTPGQAGSDSTATMLYQHSDHLTTRLTTDNNGDLSNEQAHYPYGEQWYAGGTADPSVLRKFTSYQREDEAASGKLNYAVYREQSARIGRFHMADPARGNVRNPQRLNRYAYVSGNPTNRIDPRGLDDGYIGVGDGGTVQVFVGGVNISITNLPGLPGSGDMYALCESVNPFMPGKLDICPASDSGDTGGGLFSFAIPCPAGTTSCSYYSGMCTQARNRMWLWLLCGYACAGDVPGMIAYYCGAAPVVCRNAGNNPYANCVRLCLQNSDNCFGRITFTACQVKLHEDCFARCIGCAVTPR
ncbi:MAG: hypothetical protein M1453_13795 [Acidobacteria bacterium]|nr:hypothetical protein [Acidobacteriota bacterium]MCL5289052.1 hypothetical protein [Acidobacteriota bacterium]